MKIVFFEVRPDEHTVLEKGLSGNELIFLAESLTEETVHQAADADVISVFIYSKITKELLTKMHKLKGIATRSTGFDHIAVDSCHERNVIVSNVPYYGENTVAEHTFALILSLSRHIHKSYVRTVDGNYSLDGLRGFDLKGKTLGVIGAGHIGLHVIRMAKGFGMNVIAFDPYQHKFLAEVLQFSYVDLDALFRESDIISLHVPYRPEMHHLLNKEAFDKMKQGSILINTSRGGLVDTEALFEALEAGKLLGAGLDVLEGEELIKEERQLLFSEKSPDKLRMLAESMAIVKMNNVVFTPHNAFNSQEAVERILQTTVDNVQGFISGKPLNKV